MNEKKKLIIMVLDSAVRLGFPLIKIEDVVTLANDIAYANTLEKGPNKEEITEILLELKAKNLIYLEIKEENTYITLNYQTPFISILPKDALEIDKNFNKILQEKYFKSTGVILEEQLGETGIRRTIAHGMDPIEYAYLGNLIKNEKKIEEELPSLIGKLKIEQERKKALKKED